MQKNRKNASKHAKKSSIKSINYFLGPTLCNLWHLCGIYVIYVIYVILCQQILFVVVVKLQHQMENHSSSGDFLPHKFLIISLNNSEFIFCSSFANYLEFFILFARLCGC